MGGSSPGSAASHFAAWVWLTKSEVFAACQALADADRVLTRAGGGREASALGDLFELLEDRLSLAPGLAFESGS
jgi:hypothetical protein